MMLTRAKILIMFKPKKLEKDFIDSLLKIRSEVEEIVVKSFNEDFGYTGDQKTLQYESMIFLLWLISISIPDNKDDIRGDFYNAFADEYSSEISDEIFDKEIDRRHTAYYDALGI